MLPSDKSLIIEGLKYKTLQCNTDFNGSNLEWNKSNFEFEYCQYKNKFMLKNAIESDIKNKYNFWCCLLLTFRFYIVLEI